MMLVWVFCGVFMRSSISRCVVLKITLSVIMWYTISNNGEGRGVGGETWCYVAIFSFCYLQHRTWRKRKFVQLVNCSILSWDYVPFFPHCKSDKRPGGGAWEQPGNKAYCCVYCKPFVWFSLQKEDTGKERGYWRGERVGRDCHGTCLGCGVHVCML